MKAIRWGGITLGALSFYAMGMDRDAAAFVIMAVAAAMWLITIL